MGFNLTNVAAAQAVQAVNAAQQQLKTSEARLSTGLKVASVKDDGSTWAIAQQMRSDVSDWQAVSNSLARGQSTVDVASSGAETISSLLGEIQAKAVAYSAAPDAASQSALVQDIQAKISQVDNIARAADFNGVNLLDQAISLGVTPGVPIDMNPPAPAPDGVSASEWSWNPGLPTSSTGTYAFALTGAGTYGLEVAYPSGALALFNDTTASPAFTLSFVGPSNPNEQVTLYGTAGMGLSSATFTPGTGSSQPASPSPPSVLSDPSGGKMTLDSVDLTAAGLGLSSIDWSNPQAALATIGLARQTAVAAAAAFGNQQDLLSISQGQAQQRMDVLNAGVSNLVDADLAKESAQVQAAQAKVSLSAQALAIANSAPGVLLSLFR